MLIATIMLTLTTPGAEPDWAQWRGPNRDGIIAGKAWPTTLNGLEQNWQINLAESYSGPIVTRDRIFVTETAGRKMEIVRALNRKTGKQIWEAKWTGSLSVPFFARSNGSWIRATPAFDGDSLYVAGMRDVLVCLNAANGEERWRVDFRKRYKTPLPAFGFVSSPLVTSDSVYVQAGASVVKLDKKTGKSSWRSLNDGGGMFGSAFSSPVLATLAGKKKLVVQTRTRLAGLDLTNGNVLWTQKVQAFRGMNILTPNVQNDQILTSAYGGKTHLFEVSQSKGKFSVKEKWNVPIQGYMSSPVVIDGHAYLHLKNRRFCCINLKTGKETWRSKKPFGRYWSMIAQKNQILALDETGILYLIEANPNKLVIRDEKSVSKQPTWAHLAIAGDEIFIRELRGLVSFQWSVKTESK